MMNKFRFCLLLIIGVSLISILYFNVKISKSFFHFPKRPLGAADPTIVPENNFEIGYKYCYKNSSLTIVFLQLTNKTDEWHHLEACVFKRAAILNPEAGVCVLTKSEMKPHPQLASLPNLEFAPLNIRFLLNGTPIISWYDEYVLNETRASEHVVYEFSDGLRYAYLFHFGGIYLDSDVIVLRNLHDLRNSVGLLNDYIDNKQQLSVSNSLLLFDQGHPFMKAALDQLVKNFEPGYWGSAGPVLLTKIHDRGLVNRSSYRILDPVVLHPVDWFEGHLPFSELDKEIVKSMIKDSYTLHLWRHIPDIKKYWGEKKLPAGCILAELCND